MKDQQAISSRLAMVIGFLLLSLSMNSSFAMDAELMKKLDAKSVKFSELRNQRNLLIVSTDKKINVDIQSRNSSGKAKIIVDGILVELPIWVIKGNIRNGFFKVIWAGSGVNDGGDLPPEWLPEYP